MPLSRVVGVDGDSGKRGSVNIASARSSRALRADRVIPLPANATSVCPDRNLAMCSMLPLR